MDFAGFAIKHDRITGPRRIGDALGRTHEWYTHGPRDDGNVRTRRDFLEHKTDQTLAAVVEKFSRPHCATDDDRVFGEVGSACVAGEVAKKASSKVIEVMRA